MADDHTGNLRSLNDLAREARAHYIIHTGDFGFYDDRSLDRIAEKYLHTFFLSGTLLINWQDPPSRRSVFAASLRSSQEGHRTVSCLTLH